MYCPCQSHSINVCNTHDEIADSHYFILFVGWQFGQLFVCSAEKVFLLVRTATSREATYFPNRYFRRMVVSFMVHHCQLVMKCKFWSLSSHYGVVVEQDLEVQQSRGWAPPLSYHQYLHLMLRRDFWGDKVVLFTMSCLWSVRITVLNSKTQQEYRIRHDRYMEEADIVIVYNGANHFTAVGKGQFTCRCTVFACKTKAVGLPINNTVYNVTWNDSLADAQFFY